VAVGAGRGVGLLGAGGGRHRRVAGDWSAAVSDRGPDDRVGPGADAGLAGVALRAGVAVGAGRAVGLLGVGAGAVRRVTGTSVVRLEERGADDGGGPGAGPGLAGETLGGGVAGGSGQC